MRGRSVAGCLLLVLTAVCAIQVTLDSATFHIPIRRQWRMQTQQQGAARLSGRRTIGVPGECPETPILPLAHLLVLAPRRDVPCQFPTAVFVPPRA
jgi:hypothetical protein